MPRDGSNIYHRPPGTDGVPNTTIASTPYNGYVADVEQDLNLPRPIVAGGTGAADAVTAMTNLGGEIAKQLVTNYDTFAFLSGSFYSAAGATSAPTAHAFIGICYATDANNIVLEARDEQDTTTPGRKYVREKKAGVWGAWAVQAGSVADLDAAYVNVAGDTMTGSLTVTMADPGIGLSKTAGAHQAFISGYSGSLLRWTLILNNAGPESGGNAGGDFGLNRYTDAGTFIDTPLSINRATGTALFSQSINVTGNVSAGGGGVGGNYYFGNTGTKYLNYDGTNFNFSGGNLNVNSGYVLATGNFSVGAGGVSGSIYFGNTGTKTLNYDGTNFNFIGGSLNVSNSIVAVSGYVMAAQGATVGAFYFGNAGTKYLTYDGTNFNFIGGNVYMPFASNNTGFTLGRGGSFTYGLTNVQGVTLMLDCAFFEGGGLTNNTVMHVNRNGANGPVIVFDQSATACGSITVANATSTAFNTASDERLKEDLKSFDAGNIIDATNVYDFKWKSIDERSYGIIAQQAKDVYPMAVSHDEMNDWWGIDYSKYVPVLLQELKALRARVAQLEAKVNQ